MSDEKDMAFKVYDVESAPADSQPTLQSNLEKAGFVSNLKGVMAGAPALLKAYDTVSGLYAESSLSPVEQQLVLLVSNFENECGYCMAWHTLLAMKAQMKAEDIAALRDGAPLADAKLEALRIFARDVVRTRGNIAPVDLQRFFDAGYSEQHAMEVVLGLALKVMSNYTNAIAGTPLDENAQRKSWNKPKLRKT